MKQKNLYAEELWKRNWFMAPLLVVMGVGFTVYFIFVVKIYKDLPLLLAESLGGAALILLFFGSFRYLSYVQITEEGLKLNWTFPFRSTVVPYTAIRNTRVGNLKEFYPDSRKRYINAMTKPLLEKPAFYARLGGDTATMERLGRRLGNRYVVDGTIAVPVPDPKSLSMEVSQRLPIRQQTQNLGGSRRRRRRH